MSWDKTYTHTVLIAVDQFFAAVLFNRADITISSMCWQVQTGNDAGMKFNRVQRGFLKLLAPILNWIQTGHCALARQGDLDRATAAQIALAAKPFVLPGPDTQSTSTTV